MISINIERIDNEKNFLCVKNDRVNVWSLLSLMQFEDNMDYFGIELERAEYRGEIGYLFSVSTDKELVYFETERFIKQHNIENLNPLSFF